MTERSAGSDPREAAGLFELLSDETRIRIVAELYRQWQPTPESPCLPFSTLHGRIGGDSGRFNYHLRRLRDGLVDKRSDGYALTPLGIRLGQLVVDDCSTPIRA